MTSWQEKIINSLKLETVDIELLNNIDEILAWTGKGDGDEYLSLQKDIGSEGLYLRIEEFLDRLIVGDCALGEMFPPVLSEGEAKKRYRQLIRIFHPDRGVKPEVWLNYRAEKINKAYDDFVNGDQVFIKKEQTDSVKAAGSQKSKEKKTKASRSQVKFTYRPNVWRERLGNPKEFQRKILIVLFVIALLLVLLVYLSNKSVSENSVSQEVAKNTQVEAVKSQESFGSYVVESEAQKILKEADVLFRREGIDGDEYYTPLGDSISEEVISNNDGGALEVEGSSLVNDLVLHEKLVQCDFQHDDLELLRTNEQGVYELESKLNVRSGPSKDCALLSTLTSGVKVLLSKKTKDGLWSKVTFDYGVGRLIKGLNYDGWVHVPSLKNASIKKSEVRKAEFKTTKPSKVIALKDKKILDKAKVKSEIHQALPEISNAEPVSKENKINDVELHSLIEQLKLFYIKGDSDALANLYISSGRENNLKDSNRIRKYYKKAFRKTSNRKFVYTVESSRRDGESTAVLQGKLYISYTSKKILKKVDTEINATYTALLIKFGDEYKIASLDWKEV